MGAEGLPQQMREYGVAIVLMAMICWVAWFLLSKSMQSREDDLKWARSELVSVRQEFTKALEGCQLGYAKSLDRLEKALEGFSSRIWERLDGIDGRLDRCAGFDRRKGKAACDDSG